MQAGQLDFTNKTRILLERRTTSWLLYGLLEQQSVTISVGIYNPLFSCFSIPEGISSIITKVEMTKDIHLKMLICFDICTWQIQSKPIYGFYFSDGTVHKLLVYKSVLIELYLSKRQKKSRSYNISVNKVRPRNVSSL